MGVVRISQNSENIIQLFTAKGKSKVDVIEEALECYHYHQRMKEIEEAYERLRDNEDLWQEELQERKEWEGMNDGLEKYE